MFAPQPRGGERRRDRVPRTRRPHLVSIIHALSLAELCNCDLASILGISESAVSHQMRELRLLKLVTADKRGRMVYYRLRDVHIQHVFQDTFRHVQEDRHGA